MGRMYSAFLGNVGHCLNRYCSEYFKSLSINKLFALFQADYTAERGCLIDLLRFLVLDLTFILDCIAFSLRFLNSFFLVSLFERFLLFDKGVLF